MAAYEIIPWLLTPNTRGWIVGPNYNLAQKIAREVKRIIMTDLKLPIESKKEISGDLYYMKMAGLNSELAVKSADAPDSLIGDGVDYLVIDEMALIPKNTYEMYLRPTLSDRGGWALFCSTPRGFNYFSRLYDRGQDEKYPEWESWQFPSTLSPFFKDDLDELRKTLTDETVRQEILAEFVSFAGRVYPFDRFQNIKNDLRFDPSLPTYAGIDFGYRAAHCSVFQVKHNTSGMADIYQIDEVAMKNTKTEDFARKIKSLGYNFHGMFCDPAGAGVSLQSGVSDIFVFKQQGMILKYKKDATTRNVVAGVGHVRRWFEDANGDPHLFVSPKCVESIQAYENYRYPEHRNEQQLKEMPLKDGRFDHANDALRFALVNLFPMRSRMAGVIDYV